jgi:hypothetical protein
MADGIPNTTAQQGRVKEDLMPIPLERFNGTDSWFSDAGYIPHFVFFARGAPVEVHFPPHDEEARAEFIKHGMTFDRERNSPAHPLYIQDMLYWRIMRCNAGDYRKRVKIFLTVTRGRFTLTKMNIEDPKERQNKISIANLDIPNFAEARAFAGRLREVYCSGSVATRTEGSDELERLRAFEAEYAGERFVGNVEVFYNKKVEEGVLQRRKLLKFRVAASGNTRLGARFRVDERLVEEPAQAAPAAGAGDEPVDTETLNTLIQGGLVPSDLAETAFGGDEGDDGYDYPLPLSPLLR